MSTTEYEKLKQKNGFKSAFSDVGRDDNPWTDPEFAQKAMELLNREEMARRGKESDWVRKNKEKYRSNPPYAGDRIYKARGPAIICIHKLFEELKWEFSATDGTVTEKKKGFYLQCEGVCPIHKRQHSSNHWTIYQPRETTSVAYVSCKHDGSYRRLSHPVTCFI